MMTKLIFSIPLIFTLAQPMNAQPTDTLRGNIPAGTTRTLNADTLYIVFGFVSIQPSAKLIIPAGTRLESSPSALGYIQTLRGDTVNGIYRPSGQLIANGTREQPIVFTSAAPDGQKARQQIGGIILNGNARNNVPGGVRFGEAGAGPGGGNIPTDTSGILRYLRVEFGSTSIGPPGAPSFTFNSVGSGTIIEHCQAHYGGDDGFAFFGGTVNAKYLLVTGCDDDGIDTEFGYSGKIQFVAVVQDSALANRGYEFNNDGFGTSAKPHNRPTIYNATIIGAGRIRANNENNDGLYMRANTGALLYNHIVAGYGGAGAVIDGTPSLDNLSAPLASDTALTIRNSLFFNKGDTLNQSVSNPNGAARWAIRRGTGVPTNDTTGLFSLYSSSANNRIGDPLFRRARLQNNFDGIAQDFRLQPNSPALTGGAVPPNDGFFDTRATYIGAFGDDDWTAGWTNWSRNASPRGTSSVERTESSRPKDFTLFQNYPNPFNPSTVISYQLPMSSEVKLVVFDLLGRELQTLVNTRQAAGRYNVQFNAASLSSGVYFYRLSVSSRGSLAGAFAETKKMILMK